MTPDRLISPEQPRKTSLLVSLALAVMTAGTIFLTGIVVWAILADRPDEEDVLREVQTLIADGREARDANACTNYQNHRALEEALREIARLNQIQAGEPRVLPSEETIRACKAVDIEISDAGVPQVSNVAEDHGH